MDNKYQAHIIIASEQTLLRKGVIAEIEKLSLNVIFKEIKKAESLTKYQAYNYLIIDYKMIPEPKEFFIRNTRNYFDDKIMIIGRNKLNPEFHQHIIFPNDKESIIHEKLELFFSSCINITEESHNDILSIREIDVLREVAQGYSNKEIADRLFISINTVITHRKNITDKLGIKTISGLTVYALMNNLINPEDVTI